MSHEIANVNGKDSIAYVGDEPWHGLGQRLTADADIETWAIEAGMAHEILRAPVEYVFDGRRVSEPTRHVLYRSDTGKYLNTVSNKFSLDGVQPVEVLEFFRDLADERGFQLNTAGVLFDGLAYWALAKTPHGFTLPGKDRVEEYLLLSTGVDGRATTARYTAVRVVCNNTLRMSERGNGLSVRVSHRAAFSAAAVKKELGLAKEAFGTFKVQAQELSARRVTTAEVVEYLAAVLDRPLPTEQELAAGRGTLLDLATRFQNNAYLGGDMASAKHTAWGLLNTVTEWVDHHKGENPSARLENAWFKAGADLKTRAFDEALRRFTAEKVAVAA